MTFDRRHFPRVHAPMLYRPARARLPFAPRPVVDAGLGGIRIYAEEALPVGAHLELELFFPDGASVDFEGEVAWVVSLPGGSPARFDVGIKFAAIENAALARLGAILQPPSQVEEAVASRAAARRR